MNKQMLIRLYGGLLCGFLAVAFSWALLAESSPFHQDVLRPGWARYVWQILNIPAFVATIITHTEAAGLIVVFLQWCLIGFSSIWLLERIFRKKQSHLT